MKHRHFSFIVAATVAASLAPSALAQHAGDIGLILDAGGIVALLGRRQADAA